MQVEELRNTTQESLDNMPENLQNSSTAELLQERIDSVENALSEIESIDLDYEEKEDEELKELVAEDKSIDTEDENWQDEITDEEINDKRQELESEWVQEKLEELQAISFE